MEQRNTELRDNLRQATDAADWFLRDLRGLRAQAGLDHGELAARAHYPRHVITVAEAGPALPDLPVLAAYVRGCGGTGDDVARWEDRWRSVTGAATSPLLAARVSGLSGAASAGARSAETGTSAAPAAADGQGAAVVFAALNRFADRMAQPTPETQAEPVPSAQPTSPAQPFPQEPRPPETQPAPEGNGMAAAYPPAAGEPATARRASAIGEPAGSGRASGPMSSGAGRDGQHRGVSGRTLAVSLIAVALICLLILLLAL